MAVDLTFRGEEVLIVLVIYCVLRSRRPVASHTETYWYEAIVTKHGAFNASYIGIALWFATVLMLGTAWALYFLRKQAEEEFFLPVNFMFLGIGFLLDNYAYVVLIDGAYIVGYVFLIWVLAFVNLVFLGMHAGVDIWVPQFVAVFILSSAFFYECWIYKQRVKVNDKSKTSHYYTYWKAVENRYIKRAAGLSILGSQRSDTDPEVESMERELEKFSPLLWTEQGVMEKKAKVSKEY